VPVIVIALMILVIFIILLKIFKKVLKAILLTLLIVFLLVFFAGIIIYSDATKLEKSMMGNKTALLNIDDKIVAGIRFEQTNNILNQNDVINYYTKDILLVANQTIPPNEFTIIIKDTSFSGDESVSLNELTININRQKLANIMSADSTTQLIYFLTEDQNLSISQTQALAAAANIAYSNAQPLKNMVFENLFLENIKKNGLYYILYNTRAGNIEIRPTFISVKLASYLPESFITLLIGNNIGFER
jgi:energy-coupling factor transporter transmembrane protein EcfT